MTYDKKCFDLAEAFLSDYLMSQERRERLTVLLSEYIQETIEDFISDQGLEMEP